MWSVFNHWVFIHSWLLSSAVCGFVLVDVLWFFCFWLCIWNSFVFCLIISFCLSWCCQVYSSVFKCILRAIANSWVVALDFAFRALHKSLLSTVDACPEHAFYLVEEASRKFYHFLMQNSHAVGFRQNLKMKIWSIGGPFSQVSIIRAVGQPWNWLQLATLFSVKPTGKTLKKPTIDFLKSLPYYSCKLAQIDDWGFMH